MKLGFQSRISGINPLLAGSLLSLFAATGANAALYDRGNDMIYDSVLNITFINHFIDASYDYQNQIRWYAANAAVQGLVYGGYDDWRLPSANLLGIPTYPAVVDFSFDGSTDWGYNNTRSEMGYLFFTELGNKAYYSATGVQQPEYGPYQPKNKIATDAATGLPIQIRILGNVWEQEHWDAGPPSISPFPGGYETAFEFNASTGEHALVGMYDLVKGLGWNGQVVAVRAGDVAAVPVPAAAWLFGSGLLGLAGAARRKAR
jgi:hypothetical protein